MNNGFEVFSASDGEDACRQIDEKQFEVVLTDLDMPKLGGMGLLKHIRDNASEVPVIVITGNATVQSAVEAIEVSVAAYIEKPFEPEEILRATEKALRMNQPPSSSVESALLREKNEMFDEALAGLHMNYQPIVRWASRSVYSYEALMRTRTERVPHPGVFLDLAEELGRVRELGRCVRSHVAALLSQPTGFRGLVFVNLHPEELRDDDLYAKDSPLAQSAQRVVLEITERESLAGLSDAHDRVDQLKRMGYRIAIDDIGAGYSGLNSLIDLEPDLIKLDMALVRGIDQSPRRQKLVRSLVVLAKELEIEVVAEGIETSEERDAVAELGCDLLQGYLFARPAAPFARPQFEIDAA